ncbi:hypothetical protein G7046_g1793 [Stylonectria norvegica]|nr:hypothetical protein G7046_g1793 [Stylonectria norvegica]
MLRRSHKKSRGGCSECKRRHVKCDEGRPVCRLCAMSERECSFATQTQPESLPASSSGTSPAHLQPFSSSSGDKHDLNVVDGSPMSATSLANFDSPAQASIDVDNRQNESLDEAINLNHMELLIHLTLDKGMFNLGVGGGIHGSELPLALTTGLESPYVLHQLLAFSARHLAFLHPERSANYLHQAFTLQTRAISLFNTSFTAVDRSNCVAVLLFSSVLGHHLLADTLAKRDPGGLEVFLEHYVQALEMHRGTHTIAMAAWPLLMETKLEPILSTSSKFTGRSPRGNHCQQLIELIRGADGLREEEKEACQLAIHFLQVGFDAILADEGMEQHRYQMIFSWKMLAPPKFTALLAAKRPEVLVILAYYALLLYYGRDMWQVGDAGPYILGIIVEYLGPEWDRWLQYPRQRVGV